MYDKFNGSNCFHRICVWKRLINPKLVNVFVRNKYPIFSMDVTVCSSQVVHPHFFNRELQTCSEDNLSILIFFFKNQIKKSYGLVRTTFLLIFLNSIIHIVIYFYHWSISLIYRTVALREFWVDDRATSLLNRF